MPHFDHERQQPGTSSRFENGAQQQQQLQQIQQHLQQQQNKSSQQEKIKCVFLGDGAVGKTSLIISYTTNGYPSEYVPTAIDTYDVVVHVDGEPVTFEMCDTPGQDDFDTLRPLVYAHTDVFLLCFSVVQPSSFQNVREKWIQELKKSQKNNKLPPVILVGTQSDLREDAQTLVQLNRAREQPVSEAEARKLAASIGCQCYVESSSLTQKNLKEVFDEAIMAGLRERKRRERKSAKRKAQKGPGCLGRGGGGGQSLCNIL